MPGTVGLAVATLWYLLLALAGPGVALARRVMGERPQWWSVTRNFSISVCMIIAFLATGLLIAALADQLRGIDNSHLVDLGFRDVATAFVSVFGVVGVILAALISIVFLGALFLRLKNDSWTSMGRRRLVTPGDQVAALGPIQASR